jgi:polysaccharide biosynthesis transport protein
MDYARVMTALRRRRWWIVCGVISCTALTFVGARKMKREYQASATLMAQEQALQNTSEMAAPLEAGREQDEILGRQDRIKTVSTILTSPTVLGKVIHDLGLKTTPVKLAEDIEVKEVTTQVARVSYKDSDPDKAGLIVNAITDNFVTFFSELRSREARKQLDTLERERKSAQQELQQASAQLQSFKKSSDISSLQDQMRVGLERASEIEQGRNTAEARLREVSAQVASVQDALARTPTNREIRETATQTALLDKLRLDVTELQAALTKELSSHTEEHPNVKRLQGELGEAQRRLDAESAKMNTSVRVIANPEREALETKLRELRNERDGLVARVASLNADLSRVQSQVSGFSGKDVQLNLLQQRYTLAEQRMSAVNGRLGQIKNVADLLGHGSPIAVVDRPGQQNPPMDMTVGRTLRLTALAFIMSLAVCIGLAIGLEMADRRVRDVADAEALMQLKVVSVVPALPARASQGTLCLTAENDPSSHMAEAYHFLANHVLRQTMQRESTVLMAATGRPGQGATTALCNLAIALARAGRQVVLVESDLRRPFLHQVFDVEERPGLTDVLQGRASATEALSPTHVRNLRLLASGRMVPDPWCLLLQPSMGQAVQELREQADYVLLNVPSATVFADALCVAPHVDGAILVMRTSEVPTGGEQKVREWLEELNVPVMGTVLNGVPSKDMDTYEFHRSYGARRADTPALGAPVTPPVRRAA